MLSMADQMHGKCHEQDKQRKRKGTANWNWLCRTPDSSSVRHRGHCCDRNRTKCGCQVDKVAEARRQPRCRHQCIQTARTDGDRNRIKHLIAYARRRNRRPIDANLWRYAAQGEHSGRFSNARITHTTNGNGAGCWVAPNSKWHINENRGGIELVRRGQT